MIKILANSGGVMGLNFCNFFLGNNDIPTVQDIVTHIKHIANIGGIDVVSIGSDFDGIPNKVEIENIGQIYKLQDNLYKSGFKEDDIEKIMYKNALRVIKDVLQINNINTYSTDKGVKDMIINIYTNTYFLYKILSSKE